MSIYKETRMGKCLILILAAFFAVSSAEEAMETEMFSVSITPKMFNWTYQEFDKQYVYHPSLIMKPDLPDWLHYVYSSRHQAGFVYGTPPLGQKDITLEIVALNRVDYETRRLAIPVTVRKKPHLAKYQVQLKIDNLNVEDLLDHYRMEKLMDIFRKKLWKESGDGLYPTFIASAIEMGARLPLKPTEGDGVILKLGNHKEWSEELLQLQQEVRPLSKLSTCPRDFKRTTVERLFRDAGFNLDWCSFRLWEASFTSPSVKGNQLVRPPSPSWLLPPPSRSHLPHRSYLHEFTLTLLLPVLVILLLLFGLSLVLCFHNDGVEDVESEIFFRDIFHICSDYWQHKRFRNQISRMKHKAEYQSDMTGMTLANAGTTDVLLPDDVSEKKVSPNNSLNPKSGVEVDYNRPQPPPYIGSTTNTLSHKGGEARAHSLEESLQILNQANISHRPPYHGDHVVYPERDLLPTDSIGGNAVDEDYVLIKPDNETFSLKRDFKGIKTNTINSGLKGFGNKI